MSFISLLLTSCSRREKEKLLEVWFFDVGQGDAILINFPDDTCMLIDAGDNHTEKALIKALSDMGVDNIDRLVGTHPDSDHIGGIDGIISNFDIGDVYLPDIQANTNAYDNMINEL
ncbi:MAG TPA: MBL fold metallo-hydrolase, partial [Clostridia bacterium]|nr:MBL fold metallo-hydrolase [Clostridia bacterium]